MMAIKIQDNLRWFQPSYTKKGEAGLFVSKDAERVGGGANKKDRGKRGGRAVKGAINISIIDRISLAKNLLFIGVEKEKEKKSGCYLNTHF